jgi:hypothetical protein
MKSVLLIFFIFTMIGISAQTVVKMDMPEQADEALKVVALFEEEIPTGIPVVLGLMGYEVEGGFTPYLFEWLLNNKVISTNDVVIFTSQKGDELELKVTDNNKCRASTYFKLKFATIEQAKSDSIAIYPTIVKDKIQIWLPEKSDVQALVRVFDVTGKMVHKQTIWNSTGITPSLASGTYFVSVRTTNEHKVGKIIVE